MGTERATKVCAAARDGGLFRGGKEGRERPRGREGEGRALIWHLKRNDGGFPRKRRNSAVLCSSPSEGSVFEFKYRHCEFSLVSRCATDM